MYSIHVLSIMQDGERWTLYQSHIFKDTTNFEMFVGSQYPTDATEGTHFQISPNRDGYMICYPDGYESWCPSDQFEDTNRVLNHAERCLIPQGPVMKLIPTDPDSVEEFTIELNNQVYSASLPFFEGGEHADLIRGNGHHMAQKIAGEAKTLFIDRIKDSDLQLKLSEE